MNGGKLNLQQEKFCQLYARSEEFFGNGVESYLTAYEIDPKKGNAYNIAAASASRLLKTPKVLARINEILEETGFNDVWVDKQLAFVITQHADFGSKVAAIKEYNKLKGRITEKSMVTVKLPKPILGGITMKSTGKDKRN